MPLKSVNVVPGWNCQLERTSLLGSEGTPSSFPSQPVAVPGFAPLGADGVLPSVGVSRPSPPDALSPPRSVPPLLPAPARRGAGSDPPHASSPTTTNDNAESAFDSNLTNR